TYEKGGEMSGAAAYTVDVRPLRTATRARVAQPPPVHKGVAVPPVFQAWARDNGFHDAADLSESRSAFGIAKYGQPLMTEDGRDSIEDAIDEIGDFFHYVQKAIMNKEDLSRITDLLAVADALLADAAQGGQ
ncbi:MAG: hypothetical protein R8K48_07120, partial [Gallionella sp.]